MTFLSTSAVIFVIVAGFNERRWASERSDFSQETTTDFRRGLHMINLPDDYPLVAAEGGEEFTIVGKGGTEHIVHVPVDKIHRVDGIFPCPEDRNGLVVAQMPGTGRRG